MKPKKEIPFNNVPYLANGREDGTMTKKAAIKKLEKLGFTVKSKDNLVFATQSISTTAGLKEEIDRFEALNNAVGNDLSCLEPIGFAISKDKLTNTYRVVQ